MKNYKILSFGLGIYLILLFASSVSAQGYNENEELVVVPPPMKFETASAHYAYLLEQAGGGTQHTAATIPQWPGLWDTAGNTIGKTFLLDPEAILDVDDEQKGGRVRTGILTPPYEQAFQERRQEMREAGQQKYDRLTHCESPGYPRFLLEPYTREFINLPHQSWQLNDLMNENRRIYIDQEHINVYGTHSWLGDSIGFWDGDRLITNTVDILPVDYFRGLPLTSNQFESVEVWEMKIFEDGSQRLEVQVTFYDEHSLIEPIHAVYAYKPATVLMEIGSRIRQWECETSSNSYLTADGETNFLLPGEPGYKDARGVTLFPHLPGQSRDPVYETGLEN